MGLGAVRHFPTVQQPLQHRLGDRGRPLAVLAQEAILRGLDVHDANAGVIVREELDALRPQLPAQVGRVPHERPAAAEVLPRLLPRSVDDLSLFVGWVDVKFCSHGVQGDHRPVRQVVADPGVLARAGQSRHQHDLGTKVLVGRRVGVTLRAAEIEESRVVRRKRAGGRQAALLLTELDEQGDVVQQALPVLANAAPDVGLGQEGKPVAAGRLTDFNGQPPGVGAVHQVVGNLVMTDQRRDLLADGERHAQPPEELPCQDGTAPRMAPGGDPAVRVRAGAGRLGDVVQQGGSEEDLSFVFRQGPPARQASQGLGHHPRVDPHVALGVVDRVLRTARQGTNPREALIDPRPVHEPGWFLGTEVERRVHPPTRTVVEQATHVPPPNRSTSGASWLGRIGRRSQWVPESSTVVRKLPLMNL